MRTLGAVAGSYARRSILMCRAVQCSKCHKPTWAGCGAHVEQVLGHVPKEARCTCRDAASTITGSKTASPGISGALRRIFGK